MAITHNRYIKVQLAPNQTIEGEIESLQTCYIEVRARRKGKKVTKHCSIPGFAFGLSHGKLRYQQDGKITRKGVEAAERLLLAIYGIGEII